MILPTFTEWREKGRALAPINMYFGIRACLPRGKTAFDSPIGDETYAMTYFGTD